MNARKSSLVVTQQGWDAAAAQGLCQLVGFKLGRYWGNVGPGTDSPPNVPPEPSQILSCGEAACQKTSFSFSHFSSGSAFQDALAGFGTESPRWDTGAAVWAEGKEQPSWHEEIALQTRIFQQERVFHRL